VAFQPPAVDEIEQEQPKFIPPAADEFDPLQNVKLTDYDKYKLAVAHGQPPENFAELGIPASLNPDYDIVREGGAVPGLSSALKFFSDKVIEPAAAQVFTGLKRSTAADVPVREDKKGGGAVALYTPPVEPGKPMLSLPRLTPEELEGATSGEKIAAGIGEGLAGTIESFTTPGNVATLPFAELKPVQAYFGAQMAASVPEALKAIGDAKDPQETARAYTSLAANLGMGALLAHSEFKEGGSSASQIKEAATVHGDVRSQPIDVEAQVSPAESSPGVQSRPTQEAQVPLSDEHSKLLAQHMTEEGHSFGKLREGAVMLADHDTGQVIVDPEQFSKWVDRDLKDLSPEEKKDAVRSAFEHEDIHLKTDPDDAEPFWESMSPFEQYVLKRQYLKGQDASKFSPAQLGFEAIRNRIERAMGMTRSDFVGLALHERWTAQALDHLAHIVGKIRSLKDSELSEHQKSILDKVRENINSARDAVVSGAGAAVAEQPFMTRRADGTPEDDLNSPLPPLMPDERVVLIRRPDGSVYRASYSGKQYDVSAGGKAMIEKYGGSKVDSIGRVDERGQWSHGLLKPGEKIIKGFSPFAAVERSGEPEGPAMLRKKGKPGEQEELFGAMTARGVPGEETIPLQERASAAQAGAKEVAPEQKIFPKDIGFDQPGREMTVRPISSDEASSPEELNKFLTSGARSGGSELPVSATKRITALFDKTDGSVHLVSTYKGDNVTRIVDPEIAGKERNSRPIADLLHRYTPFASILLSEPRQGFHQKFMSMADYQQAFGDEAATLVREHGTGTEGIPMTRVGALPEVEVEYPVEPGKESSESFLYPQEREPNLPRPTEQELKDFHNFFGDTPPSDATMFSRKIEREAATASRSMINGLRKLVAMEQAQTKGLSEGEALGRVLDKLYENYSNSDTRSDFIQRTMEQGSYGAPKEVPPGGKPRETGARELTTLRSRAPTSTTQGRIRKLSPTPPQGVEVNPVEMLPGEEGPAMLRKVEDTTEKLKAYLRETSKNISSAGNLSDQLYRLKTSEKADYDLALPVIKSALKIIPEADRPKLLQYADEMQVLKKSNIQLTDAQQTIYETFLKPLMEDNQKMYRSLMRAGIPVGESTYLGRVVQDTHSLYNRLWQGAKQRITEGSLLGQGASFFKRRVFKALEAPDGSRRLIALVGDGKETRVIGYEKGKAELLGKMPPESLEVKELTPQQQRTQRIVEARRLAELDKLDKEEQALLKEQDRLAKDPNADPVKVNGIKDRLASINGDYADVAEKYPSPVFDVPRMWKDKNGKTWRFTDATINEIESNTNTRYYQEPMSGIITQNLKLKQIYRAKQFLEDLKNSGDFKRISRSSRERNIPEDWRPVKDTSGAMRAFQGLMIEPRTADVLDLFAEEQRGPSLPMKYVTKLTNFLRNSLFVWNPFVHEPNLLAHWFTARGIEWGKPMGYDRMLKSGVQAFNDVLTRSRFRDQALRAGAPLMRGMGKINQEVLNLLRKELDPNPSLGTRIARGLGYINPLRMIRAFGDSLTWGTNEVLTLQLIRETMARTGLGLEDAISEVGKHMPNYRIPPRVLNSRLISHVMRNPLLTLWGHYHYGALRSYGEIAKEVFSPNSTKGQRLEGLGRVATIGFLMAVAYPIIDDIVNKVLKTKGLKMRRAGSATFPQGVMDVARGKKTPEALVQSVLTPSPVTQGAMELAFNRNLRTGLPVYERHPSMDTLKDLGSFAAQKISPIEEAGRVFGGKKSGQEFALGLAGITRTRTDSAMSRFGRMADNWMRTNSDEDIREQYKRRTQDVFQESDYQLLRSAIIRQDERAAQMAVNKLLKTRKPEEVDRRIKQWKDSPFTGTRKTDRALMAEMTPEDWDLWYQAAQERLDIADGMRNALVDALLKPK